MKGNISKTRGVLGATGPQGLQGERGEKGEKGDTPALVLRYDKETGNLYYNSDGILLEKEYVASQDLVTKDEVGSLAHFVINLDSTFAGDKTYDEIVTAYKEGKEIIGVMPDMNIAFRFSVTAYADTGVQLMGQMASSVLILMCTSNTVWSMDTINLVSDTQLENKLKSMESSLTSGVEKTTNKTTQITANSTSTQYPSAKAVYNLVNTTEYDLQTQINNLQEEITEEVERNNSQELRLNNVESDISNLKSAASSTLSVEITDDVLILKQGG